MLLITITLASCKAENPNQDIKDNNTLKGDMNLEFEHFFGKELFELNKVFYNNQKDALNFSKLTYYISNIELKKSDGTIWKEPKSYHLNNITDFSALMISVKDVPKGDYSSISFID